MTIILPFYVDNPGDHAHQGHTEPVFWLIVAV